MQARRNLFQVAVLAAAFCGMAFTARAEEALRVYAAGSTRNALTEIAQAFTAKEGIPVQPTFGASGLLADRLRGGEAADVFVPADLPRAQALHKAGLAASPVLIAHSRLCVVTRPGLAVTQATLLDVITDPTVKILAPAPADDSTGVYVWKLYERAEALRPGSYRLLDAKTQKPDLRNRPANPPGKNGLAAAFDEGKADLMFVYCNSAKLAAEGSSLKITEIPAKLAVPVSYGVTVLNQADHGHAQRFVEFLVSPEGQAILAKWGFTRL